MNKQQNQLVTDQTKKRNVFSCSAMLLTLFLCSCTTTHQQATLDPFESEVQQSGILLPTERRKISQTRPVKFDRETEEGVVYAVANFPQSTDAKQHPPVIFAHHEMNSSHKKKRHNPVVTAPFTNNAKNHFVTPISYQTTKPNRKRDFNFRQTAAKRIDQAIEYAAPDPENYPDEYLWDGGDRDYPVHFDRFNRLGLETEDTIAEYSDHTGKRHQKPTNRVAIYAPRFNVVRTMSTPVAGASIASLGEAQSEKLIAGMKTKTVVSHHNQQLSPNNMRLRSRASGLENENILADLNQSTNLVQHEKVLNLFEEISFLHNGQFEKSDKPILAKAILAAATWSKDLFPIIQAQTDGIGQLEARFQQQELVGVDSKHLKKGRLRIVKLADKKIALSGDVITFKIRYDNLGDLELHHIKIIDNLTPRLEYIEDSASSDLKGRLDVEENGEGSLVLKFILEESLKGHTGGVITFQTKVR